MKDLEQILVAVGVVLAGIVMFWIVFFKPCTVYDGTVPIKTCRCVGKVFDLNKFLAYHIDGSDPNLTYERCLGIVGK